MKKPLQLISNDGEPDKAPVSPRFARSVTKHNPQETPSLFALKEDDTGSMETYRIDHSLLAKYENLWTGTELEVMTAIFKRLGYSAGRYGEEAHFRSVYELCKLASGAKGDRDRSRTKYEKAVKTLQTPHFFLFAEDKKTFLHKVPPIILIEREDEQEGKSIIIRVAPEVIKSSKALGFIPIPLALSRYLKRGGIQRIDDGYAKLFFYLASRFDGREYKNQKSGTLKADHLYEAAGWSHYFDQRNGMRARKNLETFLNALRKVGALESWQYVRADEIQFTPNMFFWKFKRGKEEPYTNGAEDSSRVMKELPRKVPSA